MGKRIAVLLLLVVTSGLGLVTLARQETVPERAVELSSSAAPESVSTAATEIVQLTLGSGARKVQGDLGNPQSSFAEIHAGDPIPVVGISDDFGWYLVVLPGGKAGWVEASNTKLSGTVNENTLPVVHLPEQEPPTAAETATAPPTETSTATVTAEATATKQPTLTFTAVPTDAPTDVPTSTQTPLPTWTASPVPLPTQAPTQLPPTVTPEIPTITPIPSPVPTSTPSNEQIGVVTSVVDGDTINVSIGGVEYPVRYIGIDTAESGEPCGPEATQANAGLVLGREVRLVRDVSEVDQYGRLLRYVYVGDLFVNAELVRQGWAEAIRYPPDTSQAGYLEAQAVGAPVPSCAVRSAPIELPTNPPPAEEPPPTPEPTAEPSQDCDPSYPTVCIPPKWKVGDLDCGQISFRRFQVLPPDPHGFDGDNDGVGCESG